MAGKLEKRAAEAILKAFELYQSEFRTTTSRAKERFESRDWQGLLHDSADRLDIYNHISLVVAAEVRGILKSRVKDKQIWAAMKSRYSELIRGRSDLELAETFFNSVTRRIFATVGVDPQIEYVDSDFEVGPLPDEAPIYRVYDAQCGLPELICRAIRDVGFKTPFRDLEEEAGMAARMINCHLTGIWGNPGFDRVDFLKEPFFRSKGAFLIGRIHQGQKINPIVLCLRNVEEGISLDAVLLTENEVSILFSFTRSYFLVKVDKPSEIISYLQTILPRKRTAELYISIGYNKHGKTELYRDLLRHLERSTDRFVFSPGQRGMVMIVFTLPSYDMVFKVIRDRFPDPKRTSKSAVMSRYQLVFKHDRAGRLVDAQEFEHLNFEKSRFSEDLLDELLREAPSVVSLDGERVDIKHVYTERRITPLDLYIRAADPKAVEEAVIDYGYAIKDLAATNIFPGDVLLKNFGVTRHGRVVFYDYDELCLLEDCKFRRIPAARNFSDEFEPEPWFFVGPDDVFPEEFETFLGLQGRERERFLEFHRDLFGVEYWRSLQKQHEAGVVIDIFPYKQSRRLREAAFIRGMNEDCPD